MKHHLKDVVIVAVGNEKGGVGKSTMTHCFGDCVRLDGGRPALIDLDYRQRSTRMFLKARRALRTDEGKPVFAPHTIEVSGSTLLNRDEAAQEDEETLINAINACRERRITHIFFDCPGASTSLARVAHALADVIITPMQESLVDLGPFGDTSGAHARLGPYAKMVAETIGERKQRGWPSEWRVLLTRTKPMTPEDRSEFREALLASSNALRRMYGETFRVVDTMIREARLFPALFAEGHTPVTVGAGRAREVDPFSDAVAIDDEIWSAWREITAVDAPVREMA